MRLLANLGLVSFVLVLAACNSSAPRQTDYYSMAGSEGLVASGYAVIASQRGNTPAQQRLMAIKASKLDAYRALAEQVYGQYVDATGVMVDMTVTQDQVRSRVEGVIYGAKVLSIAPIGTESYRTQLSLPQKTVDELIANYLDNGVDAS